MKSGYQAPALSVVGVAMLIWFVASTFALNPAAAQGTPAE
jgi:hypothetical protein